MFGYFYSSESETPAYDPGTDVDCLLCNKPLSVPMRTVSFMALSREKSYFYRTHKKCYEDAETFSPHKISDIEGSVVDSDDWPELLPLREG